MCKTISKTSSKHERFWTRCRCGDSGRWSDEPVTVCPYCDGLTDFEGYFPELPKRIVRYTCFCGQLEDIRPDTEPPKPGTCKRCKEPARYAREPMDKDRFDAWKRYGVKL